MTCESTGLHSIRLFFMSFFLKIEIHSVVLVSISFPVVGEDFFLGKRHLVSLSMMFVSLFNFTSLSLSILMLYLFNFT